MWNAASKFNLAGGTLRAASLDLRGGSARLNWTAGTLLVDGIGSNVGGVLSIPAGGTLGGTGTLPGTTLSLGGPGPAKISPGDVIGDVATLSVGGGAALTNSSTFAVDGAANGSADELDLDGQLILTDAQLNVSVPAGAVLTVGQVVTIINNRSANSTAGRFANATPTGLGYDLFVAGTQAYAISYVGGAGNDVTLTTLGPAAAVPKPRQRPSGSATSPI